MKLSDAVVKAFDTKWSISNTYNIQIITKPSVDRVISGGFSEDINMYLADFKTPDLSDSGDSMFIAGDWKLFGGRENIYDFSMTFRDYDQNYLYSKFISMYRFSRDQFPDDVMFDVLVTKEADWDGEKEVLLMEIRDCLISSISNIHFDTESEARISKFSVNAKACKLVVY